MSWRTRRGVHELKSKAKRYNAHVAKHAPSTFKIVPHTSEVALELCANEWSGLYQAAMWGLLKLYGSPRGGRKAKRKVTLEAETSEELLVAWLNELIYLIGTKRWIPHEIIGIASGARRLTVALSGGSLEGKLEREIKAATFGGLAVRSTREGRRFATVILDV